MDVQALAAAASLIRRKNAIDAELGAIIGRPPLSGHVGEWVASLIFDINLEPSASAKGIDGRFTIGPLADKTVNIKAYTKRDGVLDTTDHPTLDYYLVLCGPKATSATLKSEARPWCITSVYLFDARTLRADQVARGRRSGISASVRNELWTAAEIYPPTHQSLLPITPAQAAALALFAP